MVKTPVVALAIQFPNLSESVISALMASILLCRERATVAAHTVAAAFPSVDRTDIQDAAKFIADNAKDLNKKPLRLPWRIQNVQSSFKPPASTSPAHQPTPGRTMPPIDDTRIKDFVASTQISLGKTIAVTVPGGKGPIPKSIIFNGFELTFPLASKAAEKRSMTLFVSKKDKDNKKTASETPIAAEHISEDAIAKWMTAICNALKDKHADGVSLAYTSDALSSFFTDPKYGRTTTAAHFKIPGAAPDETSANVRTGPQLRKRFIAAPSSPAVPQKKDPKAINATPPKVAGKRKASEPDRVVIDTPESPPPKRHATPHEQAYIGTTTMRGNRDLTYGLRIGLKKDRKYVKVAVSSQAVSVQFTISMDSGFSRTSSIEPENITDEDIIREANNALAVIPKVEGGLCAAARKDWFAPPQEPSPPPPDFDGF